MAMSSEQSDILVVDDDTDIRDSIESILAESGYTVRRAENGEVALQRLNAKRPSLILLDLMMPKQNGWAVLEAIRANKEMAAVPVLVISAHASSPPAGAQGLIRKPFRREDLLQAIESHRPVDGNR
jgi:CheY-like chemotaxis protein